MLILKDLVMSGTKTLGVHPVEPRIIGSGSEPIAQAQAQGLEADLDAIVFD